MFASELTKTLKRHDRNLFAEKSHDGQVRIFRKIRHAVPVCECEGFRLLTLTDKRQFVIALTDNWTMKGIPRHWGADLILEKLRAMDLQTNERLFAEFEREEERQAKSRERSRDTENEAIASHYRRAIAKATDHMLVKHRWKDEPTKRKKDRSLKNGNR